jgi:3-oxoacyl-[acyl-carrier protein] reductase
MDLGIAGKWALVCGASKGLGLGCAQALVREGVNVLIVARGAEVLEAAATQLIAGDARSTGAAVQFVAADITTAEGRAAVFAQRRDFDIVVTNAGGPPPGDFRDWDREAWIKAVDANMLTPIELIKATVDGMAERGFGRIVNITSSSVKAPIDILGLSNGARSGLTSRWMPSWTRGARRFRPGASARRKSSAPSAPSCAAPMPPTSPARTCWPMAAPIPGLTEPGPDALKASCQAC